jgi:alkanesulfonate monooxygenase SsuD/methylene tetrahydromethanopterin reductase-like flavin-dependent oxidoreductase (luciferase family)
VAAALTRLGLCLPVPGGGGDSPGGTTAASRLAELARVAEGAGFDSLWVPDRAGEQPGRSRDDGEAYSALGALAVVTTTARLGALASPVPGRPPAIVAKQLTTVDVLSSGRAVLGLRPAGRRGPGRRVRLERLEEAVEVCRAMFGDEVATFAGRHFRLDHAVNRPRPVQPGGPPVVLAGPGGRALLAVAARRADAVHVGSSPRAVRRAAAVLAELCRRAGRDPGAVAVVAGLPASGPLWGGADLSAAEGAARALWAAGAQGVIVEAPAGVGAEQLERLGRALGEGG